MEEVSSDTGALGMTDLKDMLHGGDYSGDAPPKVHEETRSSEANFSRLIHFGKGTADLVQIIVQPLHLAGAPAHLLRPMRGPNCGFGSRVQ
ncbi:hypothetical protein R6Q59_005254 [Mikania micrantha]